MSDPRLPQEITDHIIDLLHDAPKTLRQCCLASRSCVPRARKHLFGTIRFESSADLDAWRKAFPDPLNSPAYHYTHRLGVYCAEVAAAVAKEWSSMQSFSNVVRLEIWWDFRTLPPSRVFPLILSLPLLEDLDITGGRVGYDDDDGSVFHPPTSPPFTGTLKLCLDRGMGSITRRLLNLQNGLHFQTLDCTWYLEDDPRWVTALVEGCADTLQYVHLERKAWGTLHPAGSIDFSRATKLKGVTFRLQSSGDVIAATPLKTLTSNHRDLQQILIYVPAYNSFSDRRTTEEIHRQWIDLDCFLVQLWESNKFRTRFVYGAERGKDAWREHLWRFLPEMAKRGIVEWVNYDCWWG